MYQESAPNQAKETSLSTAIVLRLAKYVYNKGHHLFFDNYFSNVELAEELLQHQTYYCGTAHSYRKRYPSALKKFNLDGGQHKFQGPLEEGSTVTVSVVCLNNVMHTLHA